MSLQLGTIGHLIDRLEFAFVELVHGQETDIQYYKHATKCHSHDRLLYHIEYCQPCPSPPQSKSTFNSIVADDIAEYNRDVRWFVNS